MANSLIDFGVVQPEAGNAFLRNFQQAQALGQQQQVQQRQNAFADLQLRAAQRGEEEAMAEREAYKGAANLGDVQQRLMQVGLGKQSIALQKQIQEQQAAKIKQAKDSLDLMKSSATAVFQNPNPDFAKQKVLELQKITGQDMSNELATIDSFGGDSAKIKQWAAGHAMEAHNLLPKFETKDIGGAVQRQGYDPLTGMRIGQAEITQKTMTPSEAKNVALREREVAIQEDKNRREKDPVFQQRMAAAKATGEAIAKGDVAAQQALPQIVSRAEEGARLIDELIGKRDEKGQLVKGAAPHPGFQNAVGATWLPGARFVAGTDAAGFMSRFDQIKGASFLEAFNALKGGGAITEKEGQKGTDAINRMSIATDEKEFVRAAIDLKNVIQRGVENAQKRAAKFGGTSAGVSVAPAAPAVGGAKFLGFEK